MLQRVTHPIRPARPYVVAMDAFDLDAYVRRSAAVALDAFAWDDVARHPVPTEVIRCLRYMQDIESHTIIYLRTLLATRAVDDPDVATFLACWFHEETGHGRALARFLDAAGHPVTPRARSARPFTARLEDWVTAAIARAWPDFVAVHMTWGAINELTTLVGYQQLAARAGHPVLSALLARITRDESRHFGFYFQQAQRRLARPGTARIARLLVDRFWAPVGTGVQPAEETRALASYLFSGADGIEAARRIDGTIRRLPGFCDAELIEAWMIRGGCPGRGRRREEPAPSAPLSREFAPVQLASR
jgi:hypothetical protein